MGLDRYHRLRQKPLARHDGARLASPAKHPIQLTQADRDMSRNDTSVPPVLRLADVLLPDQNSFGVLRLGMAMAVLVSHCFYLQSGKMSSEPLIQWTGYTLGQHGVQVFFFLSGILVAQSLFRNRSVIDFAVARTLRIFPALGVCVLGVSFILGPIVSDQSGSQYFSDPQLARYIAKTLALMTGSAALPGVFDGQPASGLVNSSLWTLKYEVLCYMMFAGAGWVAIRTGRSVLVASTVLGLSAAALLRHQPALTEANGVLDNLTYFWLFFGTGVMAYVARSMLPITWLLLVPLWCAMAVAVGTVALEITLAIGLGYSAVWLASWRMGPLRAFANHSDYSYGVYIYGVPVTQSLLHWFPEAGVAQLVIATVLITVPLAAASWRWIERPALNWRHTFKQRFGEKARRDPQQLSDIAIRGA